MDKHWYDISHTNERWTVATWLLFATLLCSFSFVLLHLTGFSETWLEFLAISGKATFDVGATGPRAGPHAGSATGFMIVMIGYSFVVPVVMAMLPAVTAQWWIMKRFGKEPRRRRREMWRRPA